MKKYFTALAFFGLLEYQALFHHVPVMGTGFHILEYSPITTLGILALCLYQLAQGSKGFYPQKEKGIFKSSRNAKNNTQTTRVSAFTIPILYLYLINFLLAAQVGHSLAFQFILVLSTAILLDNLRKEEFFVKKFQKNDVDEYEIRHYMFHRWSKYYDFFLGIWYFASLHENGIISMNLMLALLFFFMAIFFTYLLRLTYRFNLRDFLGILGFAAILTSIPALVRNLSDWHPPAFMVAAFIFLAFDLGDIYWHNRQFQRSDETSPRFWLQKIAIYALFVVFISQLYELEVNPLLQVENVYTSLFNPGSGAAMEAMPSAAPTIEVQDVQNALHVRGE